MWRPCPLSAFRFPLSAFRFPLSLPPHHESSPPAHGPVSALWRPARTFVTNSVEPEMGIGLTRHPPLGFK
jgi:hypothetical protein